tara:strand:+ start:974 stop:1300 length:327 start_codon:yes stop_codon:yes gene_type:complete
VFVKQFARSYLKILSYGAKTITFYNDPTFMAHMSKSSKALITDTTGNYTEKLINNEGPKVIFFFLIKLHCDPDSTNYCIGQIIWVFLKAFIKLYRQQNHLTIRPAVDR